MANNVSLYNHSTGYAKSLGYDNGEINHLPFEVLKTIFFQVTQTSSDYFTNFQRKKFFSLTCTYWYSLINRIKQIPRSVSLSTNAEEFSHTRVFHRLWRQIENGEISLKDVGEGVTGSKFAYTMEAGKAVNQAIIKQMNPPPESIKRSAEIGIKKIMRLDRPTDNLVKGDVKIKMIVEATCAKLAADLGFNDASRKAGGCDLVPETHVVVTNDKLHSMQLFVQGATEAEKVLNTKIKPSNDAISVFRKNLKRLEEYLKKVDRGKGYEYTQHRYVLEILIEGFTDDCYISYMKDLIGFRPNEIILFQLFVVFDFLIGNQDRHGKNWLMKLNNEGDLIGIVAIDNGNAMPEKHLTKGTSILIQLNQYAWEAIPLIKLSLHKDVVNLIKTITLGKIEQSLTSLYTQMLKTITLSWTEKQAGYEVLDAFIHSRGMKICLSQRLDKLHSIARKHFSYPELLAKCKTETPFFKYYRRIRQEDQIQEYLSTKSDFSQSFQKTWQKLQFAYSHLLEIQKKHDYFLLTDVYIDVKGDELFKISLGGKGVEIVKRDAENSPYVKLSLYLELFNALLEREVSWHDIKVRVRVGGSLSINEFDKYRGPISGSSIYIYDLMISTLFELLYNPQ